MLVKHRRSWGLIAALVAGLTMAPIPQGALGAPAAGSHPFDQPFHQNNADGTGAVHLPRLPADSAGANVACLSAAGNSTSGLLTSCAAGTDAQGSGKLRLTDTSPGATGGVFAAATLATTQGLDVTFNLYQWGGDNADGIAFVLAAVDPENPLPPVTLGQPGGALGYAGTRNLPGLANGYLGIGFDVFGNYSSDGYEGSGCSDPEFIGRERGIAGQVVVRGPGAGTTGYCGLNSTASDANAAVVPLRAPTRAASVVPVEVALNPTATAFTTASGLPVEAGTYAVAFTPVGQARRSLRGALPTVGNGLYPAPGWLTAAGIPRQLAFGWIGTTGSVVDYHEVDDASVVTVGPSAAPVLANPVPAFRLDIVKTASTSVATPGSRVRFTTTITNTGQTAQRDVAVTDTLSGTLDDAAYNGDATTTAGRVMLGGPTLTWFGDVAVGVTVTITYTVTVGDPTIGDKTMTAAATSGAPGSSCPSPVSAPSCAAMVLVSTPELTVERTSDRVTASPGTTVTYTMTIANSGQIPYQGISVSDDLSGVLDDATYDRGSASSGTIALAASTLTWRGDVAAGAMVTATYAVTVDALGRGDRRLVNQAASTVAGSNCRVGRSDPRCGLTVPVVGAVGLTPLTFVASADVRLAVDGSVVHYSTTVVNVSLAARDAVFTESLSGVLDDAVYNGDATATSGTATVTDGVLSWGGAVPALGAVTVRYSVTVRRASGDDALTTRLTSTTAGNCATSADSRCVVTVPIAALEIRNRASASTVTPEGVVTLTATFTNVGGTAYYGSVIDLGAGDILDDAVPLGLPFVSSGILVVTPSSRHWRGDIPVGATVTVSADFQVNARGTGNGVLSSILRSRAAGASCPATGTSPLCTVTVPIRTP